MEPFTQKVYEIVLESISDGFFTVDHEWKRVFAIADKETIFLDKIGDTSPSFQVKLLRVLEAKTFLPLGVVKKERSDKRVIASTNKNLYKMVGLGSFRQDLFYRIKQKSTRHSFP